MPAFHADQDLKRCIYECVSMSNTFIETGTYKGESLRWVKSNFSETPCYSCEPAKGLFNKAIQKNSNFKNMFIYNKTSQEMIELLNPIIDTLGTITFWLDAHGKNFQWPLRLEVDIFSKCENYFMFIDDFKIPFNSNAKYDTWEDQECSFEYIKDCINGKYRIYYPNYSLKVGWCLITNCELEMIQGNLIEYDHFT